jgi:MinD superfamily P-loop ATPase
LQAMPEIIVEKCNGCGLCVAVCHCNAFVIKDSVATIVTVNNCHFCTNCELVCPTGAIVCRYEIVFEEDA